MSAASVALAMLCCTLAAGKGYDDFNKGGCTAEMTQCNYTLTVEHRMTMMYDKKQQVEAFLGRLYKLEQDQSNSANPNLIRSAVALTGRCNCLITVTFLFGVNFT